MLPSLVLILAAQSAPAWPPVRLAPNVTAVEGNKIVRGRSKPVLVDLAAWWRERTERRESGTDRRVNDIEYLANRGQMGLGFSSWLAWKPDRALATISYRMTDLKYPISESYAELVAVDFSKPAPTVLSLRWLTAIEELNPTRQRLFDSKGDILLRINEGFEVLDRSSLSPKGRIAVPGLNRYLGLVQNGWLAFNGSGVRGFSPDITLFHPKTRAFRVLPPIRYEDTIDYLDARLVRPNTVEITALLRIPDGDHDTGNDRFWERTTWVDTRTGKVVRDSPRPKGA